MRSLVDESERAWLGLGEVRYGPTDAEKSSLKFRRSIYVSAAVKTGQVLSRDNIRIIRPGFGLAPMHFEALLGRRVNCDIEAGQAMRWEYIG